ncbi:hypothetical protein [Marininema halotolerans]|uniref:hypothetical protein n=1 Tax=Marininema halotolerans TaxID=1155944 RepID=UPI000B80880C|nr:hypothetical protein [Marininema halotolerans]
MAVTNSFITLHNDTDASYFVTITFTVNSAPMIIQFSLGGNKKSCTPFARNAVNITLTVRKSRTSGTIRGGKREIAGSLVFPTQKCYVIEINKTFPDFRKVRRLTQFKCSTGNECTLGGATGN